MTQGAGNFVVCTNPNQNGACLCSPFTKNEDCGSHGIVFPAAETVAEGGNDHAFVCLGCLAKGCRAAAAGPGLAPGETDNPATLHNEAPGPSSALVGLPDVVHPDALPPRHENPTADSLEEATRLLEEQDAARFDDNGGPVI